MTSPAGLSPRHSSATASFITAPMRWRTFIAVARRLCQRPSCVSTAMTSRVPIESTGRCPMRGRAKRSIEERHACSVRWCVHRWA